MNSLSSSRTNISSDENLPIQAFDSVNDDSSVISCLSGHSSSDVDSAGGDWNHDNSNDDSSSDDGSSEDDSSEDEDDDQYHFADPLYPGAPISVGESLVLILTFATRFKISEVVLAALIEVISAHCIQPHKCVKSVYKLKKTLADFDVPIIKEYFCGVCFAKLDEQYCSTCNENNVRYFLRGSIIEQLHSFFKREEFRNNLNYRFDRPKLDSQNYEDIYDGSVYKSVPNNFTASPSNVTFTWNTDGLPLFKSSKIGIWPFYLMVNELPHKMRVKKENVILAGLWIGDDKPHPNLFMNSFIDELGDLFRGVYFDIPSLAQPIRVRALIISGTADLPAIALFRNTKQYNSTYGCTNCYIQTERFENVQTYPFRENLSLRTTVDNDFYAAQAYEMDICQFGVKGPTTLAKIAYNYIEGTTIDVLHNVYEGVMKKMIILWFDEEFRTKDFSLFAYTNIINDRIKALTLLPFLPRNPRKISDFRYWKGKNPLGDDKKTSKSGVPSPNGADTCCSKPGKKGKCEDYDDEGWEEINSVPRVPKIYYGSRTHKQIEQVIREFKKTCYHDKRMTILSSREHTCIHHKVEGLSKTALCNELRDPLKNKKGCPFYNETNKGALSSHDRLASVGLETPWDIEDIVAVGKQANACPYFGARNLMGDASIIFCPYNYLIDPSIRESMGIDLTNEIVIVDEAHNIESICRDAGSAEFREDALLEAAEDCHLLYNLTSSSYYDVIHKYLLKLHEVINDVYVPESSTKYGETHSDFWKGNELWTKLTANGLGEENYSAFKVACRTAINEYNQMKEDIAKEADRDEDEHDRSKKNEKRRKKLKDPTTISHITKNLLVLMEMALMCVKDAEFTQDYRCVISKAYHQDVKTKPAKSGEWVETRGEVKKPQFLRTLKFLCMNPAIIFRGMARNTRSVILASGTLSPTTTFEGELGLTFAHQLHANHVITKDQVYVRPIGRGPNGVSLKAVYANVSSFDFKDELGSLLVQVCESVPHGVLCFFSSYAMMTGQLERWQETGVWGKLEARKCIVQEPRYSGDLDAMMREYRDAIRDTAAGSSRATGWDGALMFAVFRGKVAEGIDFSDNEARCVITVGIPYAVRTEPSVKMKMEYNDQPMNKARKLLSGSEWYNVQAYRALNQALGRCIRHRNDWGAILLVDERFLWANTMSYLPKWVREMKRDNNQFNLKDDLKKFVNERKAHDDKTKRLSN
ncbi:hypothetical protein TKK_0006539 [Trichogramma kaykai]